MRQLAYRAVTSTGKLHKCLFYCVQIFIQPTSKLAVDLLFVLMRFNMSFAVFIIRSSAFDYQLNVQIVDMCR